MNDMEELREELAALHRGLEEHDGTIDAVEILLTLIIESGGIDRALFIERLKYEIGMLGLKRQAISGRAEYLIQRCLSAAGAPDGRDSARPFLRVVPQAPDPQPPSAADSLRANGQSPDWQSDEPTSPGGGGKIR